MKQLVITFLLLSFVLSLSANENEEFRAVWVITWEHISGSSSTASNMARVRNILDNVKKANMNAVLWQVRQSGTAYYNSSYEPWGYYAGYQDPGYDPLAYAIEEAHKRGIELHAWFNVFQVSNVNASLDPLPPAAAHPNWICRDVNGNPMPGRYSFPAGLDSVRDYTVDVAMEIVNNYDIDGLHLDYVRYNEYTTGYFDKMAKPEDPNRMLDGMITEEQEENMILYSTNRYLWDIDHPHSGGVPSGHATWEDFWRWSVTEFVRTLHDSIQAVKPYVRLSPAALGKYNWSGWQGYGSVYQDAALWFNEGYVDQMAGMHYHWLTPAGFYGMLEGNCPECWGQWIQDGIDDGRLFSVGPGSYRFDDNGVWNNHPSVINRVRRVDWTDGFQFFSYGSWLAHQYFEEAGQTFFKRITKVRAASYMFEQVPDEPSISVNKIDSLRYEITINPPSGLEEDQWFALYRSVNDTPQVDTDDIIDIRFGQTAYTYLDSMSGRQNFDGKYTYFATMLDRVWNESIESNFFTTDSIPSFAPQVVSSFPEEGDTVVVSINLAFSFSKTMNKTTFTDAIQVVPEVPVLALNWSNLDRDLIVTFLNNFDYDTDYTIKIDSSVTDMIGMLLDGNGDGIGGDSYFLTFRTEDEDIDGPVVIYSLPTLDSVAIDIDVDEVVILAFDELIDESTVDESSVFIMIDQTSVTSSSRVFATYNNQSLIAVQPDIPFDPLREMTVTFRNTITDLVGNPMDSDVQITFETEPYIYNEKTMIDDFTGSGYWRAPTISGSTKGVDPALSYFQISSSVYLPALNATAQQSSGELHYVWDPVFLFGADYLLREYLYDSPPRNVEFDTTFTLQCYVYGDGSMNQFRFAIDEGNATSWPAHEVSIWHTIDWLGWKLISWDLSDPDQVGEWIGNSVLDGTRYRIDSFQLTHDDDGATSGTLFFKNLRVIKKEYNTVGSISGEKVLPTKFGLSQNFPNPFNATTQINFSLVKPGKTELIIYDMLGRKITTLVNEYLNSGTYSVTYNADNLASGVYIYELRSAKSFLRKKMILVK